MVSHATLQNLISSDVLKKICMDEGVDDVGFVEIDEGLWVQLKKKFWHYIQKLKP